MEPIGSVALSKVLGTTAGELVRRIVRPPAVGAGLVERPVRLRGWVSWREGKKDLAEKDIHKLVRELVLRASDADPVVRAMEPQDGERVEAAVTAALMGLEEITMDHVQIPYLTPGRLADQMRTNAGGVEGQLTAAGVALYGALLEVCCLHLVEFFSQRPEFMARTAIEQSNALGELLERTPDKIDEAVAFERHFRDGPLLRLDKAYLFGLRLPPQEQTYELSTAYVGLSMQWTGRRLDPEPTDDATTLSPAVMGSVLTVEEALAGRHRLLIEGPAGAGKTTLLRRLAVHVCRGDLPGQLSAWRDTVPFLLQLRTFTNEGVVTLPQPEDFVACVAKSLAGEKPGRWVSELLRSGRALVLVDGVDEVPEKHRLGVLDWLEELTIHYSDARYILTSRPAAMQEAWRVGLRRAGFATTQLEPMTRTQAEQFIDNWHAAAARFSDGDNQKLDRCATSLKEALVGRRDLARLATNPLLCAMLCALNRNNNEYLPQGRTALYYDALAMLLERRDREQHIWTGPVHLSRDQLEPLLARLAIWMTMNGRRTIPRSTAVGAIDELLPRIRHGHSNDDNLTAEIVLRHLIERTGVLQEPTVELIEFRHPSFQDYLAAVEVFQRDHLGHLLRNAHDPLYHDVAIMAVGQTQRDPARQRQILSGLIERAAADGEQGRRLWLLAARASPMLAWWTQTWQTEFTQRRESCCRRRVLPKPKAWRRLGPSYSTYSQRLPSIAN